MLRADEGPRLSAADAGDALTFYRTRVTRTAWWTGLFMVAFVVTNPLIDAPRGGLRAFARLLEVRHPSFAVGVLLMVTASVAGRSRLGRRSLDVLDATFTLVACVGFDAWLFASPPADHLGLWRALTSTNVLLGRAARSAPRRRGPR